ncbi:3-isopropylmalate dehydratase large subunit [Tengunoibacter tsumagoiensis]|uniref:3-isopropylmalate dehydratase large subunit n=1 Tax=Tengunoibacter tsumagoiensis TaxID=2014871 RepID=A0A401ZVF7_9CHLR|nr:3-isopropylmalate dehydratase large subunit [Tengunoibacter tsumagoiensis]GCE10895.1 3-isopropylmalate dehydratase large subunit [Tengunoibacter tsumagoiensis]
MKQVTFPQTMFEKIWNAHVVRKIEGQGALLYIDRHLIHEVTSPQPFAALREAGRKVHRPELTFGMVDHSIPTTPIRAYGRRSLIPIPDKQAEVQVGVMDRNSRAAGIQFFSVDDPRNGIVHVVAPEQGLTLPGTIIVCGDSHTSTLGAFGLLAFGIGTSEVEHVLASQCLWQVKPKTMEVRIEGELPSGCTAKDLALFIMGQIGAAGGTGHCIEFTGPVIRSLSMESRLTVCNMAIEAGARAGMIAPDETTFAYLQGRPFAPRGEMWERAVASWSELASDEGASYDHVVVLHADELSPQVTWGTSPMMVAPVTGRVPEPENFGDEATARRALTYMGLEPGTPIQEIHLDRVFIGSCTNSRIEDLRIAASIVRGKRVAAGLRAIVVPGSGLVKQQAEEEGLAQIFEDAGFEWREPGCSMCVGMNGDRLTEGERCASTSNRNFEGRQGTGGRTHLVSPAMAAAAAIAGHFVDIRNWQ